MDSAIQVELDGPDVSPATVDATALLELSAAYLRLLQALAAHHQRELRFHGLSIVDKCAAAESRPSHADLARDMATNAAPYIAGAEAPRGINSYVVRVQNAVTSLPPGYQAAIRGPGWMREISVNDTELFRGWWELTSFRVKIMRVGGASAGIQCKSSTDGTFTLQISADEAPVLGGLVYQHIDVDARVFRDADGVIERGTLLKWYRLSNEDPMTAMREWLQESAITPEELDELRRGEHG